MNSQTDDLLDAVDSWKGKVHEQLKGLTKAERKAYWARMGRRATALGLKAVEPKTPAKRTAKRIRRTG